MENKVQPHIEFQSSNSVQQFEWFHNTLSGLSKHNTDINIKDRKVTGLSHFSANSVQYEIPKTCFHDTTQLQGQSSTITSLSPKLIIPDDSDGDDITNTPCFEELPLGGIKDENTWHMMRQKIIDLAEENVRVQAEWITRNNEKREAIRELKSQLNEVKRENRFLRRRLDYYDNKMKHNQGCCPRKKALPLEKFFKGRSI